MGKLEEISLWYRYEAGICGDESYLVDTIHDLPNVLRCVTNFPDLLAYVSMPFSSGKRLYDRILQTGEDSRGLRDSVIKENYQYTLEFVSVLRKNLPYPVVFPGNFMPIDLQWEQKHFMALWLGIIAERVSELRMMPDWEFSNGCSEDLLN